MTARPRVLGVACRGLPTDPDETFLRVLRAVLKADPSLADDPERYMRVARAIMEEARPHHLSTPPEPGRVVDVEPGVTPTKGSRISAAKTEHAFRLYQLAQEAGLSIPEYYERLPKGKRPSLDSVHSWLKPSGRTIPRYWAEWFAKELKDPSLLLDESWPHGITKD